MALAIVVSCLGAIDFQFAEAKMAVRPSLPLAPSDVPSTTLEMLRGASGTLTPAVRASYVNWAREKVIGQSSAAKSAVPEDVLYKIESDTTLSDAIFASVYPPDRTILHNYVELSSKLGAPFVRKYRSLVIAAAVAHRKGGMTDRDLSDDETPDAEDLEVDSALPESEEPSNAGMHDKLSAAIADFMKNTQSSAIEVYEQPAKQQQLIAFLKSHDIKGNAITRLEGQKTLGHALKAAMIVLGQRPAKRQPPPDLATWLKYLATVYESSPTLPKVPNKDPMRWPLFPMDKAPWPLLMPLSRPMPLDEARYIYEKFEGQHGADRYHTYGPYRKWEAQLRAELQPSPWNWGAWPDRIVHGGVCVVMSGIAIDTHRSLCQPAVPAGQPHHSNLLTYRYDGGVWSAQIQQAFAGGPPVTHALWMFKDVSEGPARLVKKSHVGAEYHLGLGAAMDVGVRSYMDSRIAINLYRTLIESEKPTIGKALLTQATKTNPYNPEPWYRLAEQTKTVAEGMPLASAIMAHVPNANLSRVGKDQGKHEKKKKKKDKGRAKTSPAEVSQREYWETLGKFVIRSAIERHGEPADKKDAQAVDTFLRRVGLPASERPATN